jgi:Tfp pilus assembly protein PilF
MAVVSPLLSTALEHHQAGRLQQAEGLYRQILKTDPDQPDALHLLGVIARQVGMHDVAVELIGRAIQLRANSADFHNNLGGAYLDLKRFSEAASSFRRAVELKPDYALAYNNLGNALRESKQIDEAIAICRNAV